MIKTSIPMSRQCSLTVCLLFTTGQKSQRNIMIYVGLFIHSFSNLNSLSCWNRSEDWNGSNGTNCAMETKPILNVTGLPPTGTDKRLLEVVENVTESMRMPVRILNITTLSEYRKDAHASVYTIRQGELLSPEQQADPMKYADCIHWCLPGLPDTWNELLYTKIVSSRLDN